MELRYFRTLLYSKSHRVAIPLGVARNHIALLFHLELVEITSRCYFTGIAPSNHSALLFSTNQSAYCWFLVSERYKTVIRKTSPGRFQARCSRNRSRILKNIREKSFFRISCSFTFILNFFNLIF